MKIEKLRESHKKELIIGGLIISIVGIVTLSLARSKYQNTEDIKLVEGNINYKVPDLNVVAMYQENTSGGWDEIDVAPTSGYTLNTTSSVCNVNGTKDSTITISYASGKVTIANLTKKGTKCYLYFDKIKDTTMPTISSVSTTVTTSTIKVTVAASDNVGVTEYWYQIGTSAAVKSTSNTYTFSGLAAGTTYSVKVYVKDAAGNQSATTTKSVATANLTTSSIIASLSYKTTTPTFSTAATTDEGVYRVSDGMYGGYSYYWRGAATTNYVKFAGFCWRIIRINGDGTMRLIYDGTTCHANGTSTTDSIAVSNVAYNSNSTRSEYVGWKYTSGVQRPTSITSGTDAPIKTALESWYTTNITNRGYDGKVATGKFCNDRDVQSGSTWASTPSSLFNYAANTRLYAYYAPTLSCATLDTYSLKVGLITADEFQFAGGEANITNTGYYLYNGQVYWTMSPCNWNGSWPNVFLVNSDGCLISTLVINGFGVRPVINLASSTTFAAGGTGTLNNPYVVS